MYGLDSFMVFFFYIFQIIAFLKLYCVYKTYDFFRTIMIPSLIGRSTLSTPLCC
jgi:hypothetical protein